MTRLDEIRKAELKKLNDRIAALEAERDEWKKRAEQAAHIKEGDKVGFDWNVLTQIEFLEAVAEAAQRIRKHLPDSVIDDGKRYYQALLSGGEAFDLCHALDALKGAE